MYQIHWPDYHKVVTDATNLNAKREQFILNEIGTLCIHVSTLQHKFKLNLEE